MFRKKTSFKVDFLPNGQVVFDFQLNKNTKPKQVSDFFNNFITRQYLEFLLSSILESSKKNQVEELGEEICENIIDIQNQLEVRPIIKGRNPIIKPSDVMKQFGGDENE